MIKKVIVFILMFVLLFPGYALANDAFWYDYDSENVQITIKRLQEDFLIGENYSFKVTIKNTHDWDIVVRSLYSFLFSGDEYSNNVLFDDVESKSDRRLSPGERLTFTCSTEVPYNISWYKKDEDFYYDLIIRVGYQIYYSDEGEDYISGMSIDNPIAIKINNLNDGSELLQMEYLNENNVCILEKDWDNINYEEYDSRHENIISVTNISEYNLEKVLVHGSLVNTLYGIKTPIRVNEAEEFSLAPTSTKETTVTSRYNVILRNLPDTIYDLHQAIFKIDGKYYAVGLEKDIEVLLAIAPWFDCSVVESAGQLKVKLTNDTGFDFTNFFFGEKLIPQSSLIVLDENKLVPSFNRNQEKEFTVAPNYDNTYSIGYILGDYFYIWELSVRIYNDGDAMCYIADDSYSADSFYNESNYAYIFLSQVTPTQTPSPTPDTTPSPASTNTPSPTPNTSPTPPSTFTPEPSDIPSPTDPPIEITNVEKSSAIPFWVWYVLTVAIIVSAVLVINFRKKKSKYE